GLLAQTIALCHIVIEGVLAIPGEHFFQRYVEDKQLLPGLATGLKQCAKDEARHVTFGVQVLGELISRSRECRSAAIEMWDRILPTMVGVFIPPNLDASYVECFDFTLKDIYA